MKNAKVAKPQKKNSLLANATMGLIGALIGLGVFTFTYAQGYSYLSNRPEACGNCHVMREVLADWRSGDHQHVAVCNDCHVPEGFVSKWATKAVNGFHHSYAFTFTDVPTSIRAQPLSKLVVQGNCERCHAALVPDHATGDTCLNCHRNVGHPH